MVRQVGVFVCWYGLVIYQTRLISRPILWCKSQSESEFCRRSANWSYPKARAGGNLPVIEKADLEKRNRWQSLTSIYLRMQLVGYGNPTIDVVHSFY